MAASESDLVTPSPVFVLCMARSGSTLLRFLLDAHPSLACPPETNIPALCAQLAVVCSLIEGAPLAANRGDLPPEVPPAAIAGIRQTVDMITAPYVNRRGKARFCDKSLGTARYASLLLSAWPDAKFVCLFRHPMDVIKSGLDACPWGLNGYGFDAYSAGSPGNAVLALARYWLDNASAIAAVEEQHPGNCIRIRYEDLVEAPEETAQRLFAYLGVPPAPGIAERCFSPERERFGPADYKIWNTSRITGDSVGGGQSVPSGLIPPPVTNLINELLDKLGYVRVDENWGTAGMPTDPRLSVEDGSAGPDQAAAPAGNARADGVSAPADESDIPEGARLLRDRLQAGLASLDNSFAARWPDCAHDTFLAVSRPLSAAGGDRERQWLADLGRKILSPGSEDDDPDWNILGSPSAWRSVLLGELNLAAALRRCELRYCDTGDAGPLALQARLAMFAELLGLTSWPEGSPADDPVPAAAGTAVS
jgi:Sulfotransferase family